MNAQESLPPGTVLGRYRLVRMVDVGGMGTVYEAVHTDLDKRVAIKVLHDGATSDPTSRARFLQEGRAAAKIHHPHVVEVFDVGQEDGRLYLVMEFLEGVDLGDFLASHGRLDAARVVDLLLPVCAGLACAHEAGVVHRDLKPDNIFLAKTRHGATQSKLLDFGISKLAKRARALTVHESLGTPEYMSPEQVRDTASVDARTDQYALAVVLYEGVTGRRPFEASSTYGVIDAIAAGTFPPPSSLVPSLPAGFEAVLLRAMHRDASARFASVHEFGRALLPFASDVVRGTWGPVFTRASVSVPSLDVSRHRAPGVGPPRDAPTEILRDVPPSEALLRSSKGAWALLALTGTAVAVIAVVVAVRSRSPAPPRSVTAPATPVVVEPPRASPPALPPPALPTGLSAPAAPAPSPATQGDASRSHRGTHSRRVWRAVGRGRSRTPDIE